MIERLISTQDWWQNLVGNLNLGIEDKVLKEKLLELKVTCSANGDLAVITPDGQQYAGRFTTLSFVPAIVFRKTGEPAFHYLTLPCLPYEQITRGRFPNKHQWGTAEEE